MSYINNGMTFDGNTIEVNYPLDINTNVQLPYNATDTGTGRIRISTSGKLEYFDHIVGTWIQAGGAGLYYQEANTANTVKQTNIFGVLYNLDSTWYFGSSITTPLSFYEAEGM